MLCISETRCPIENDIQYNYFESRKCYRNDRTAMKTGGTAVYIKKYLKLVTNVNLQNYRGMSSLNIFNR